jgi:hypothetical protein
MDSTNKDAAQNLAWAFLRKAATKSRFSPTVRRCVETNDSWVFDFYHPRWRELKRREVTFGTRVAVDKRTGKAEHYAALQGEVVA